MEIKIGKMKKRVDPKDIKDDFLMKKIISTSYKILKFKGLFFFSPRIFTNIVNIFTSKIELPEISLKITDSLNCFFLF